MLQGKGLVPYHANFITYLTFYQLKTVLENNAQILYRCSSLRDISLQHILLPGHFVPIPFDEVGVEANIIGTT